MRRFCIIHQIYLFSFKAKISLKDKGIVVLIRQKNCLFQTTQPFVFFITFNFEINTRAQVNTANNFRCNQNKFLTQKTAADGQEKTSSLIAISFSEKISVKQSATSLFNQHSSSLTTSTRSS